MLIASFYLSLLRYNFKNQINVGMFDHGLKLLKTQLDGRKGKHFIG